MNEIFLIITFLIQIDVSIVSKRTKKDKVFAYNYAVFHKYRRYFTTSIPCRHRDVVLEFRAWNRKAPGSNFSKNTIGIRQKGHLEFKVLQCSKKSLVQKENGGGRHSQIQQRLSSQNASKKT